MADVDHLFGLSTQDLEYQREAVERLHLPFPILSDDNLELTRSMNLPTFQAEGMTLLKRLTLIIDDGEVVHVFYPVFPPDRSASDVIGWDHATLEVPDDPLSAVGMVRELAGDAQCPPHSSSSPISAEISPRLFCGLKIGMPFAAIAIAPRRKRFLIDAGSFAGAVVEGWAHLQACRCPCRFDE